MEDKTEESSEKVYTLSEESLKSLINQSFANGIISAYKTLHEAMEENLKETKFESEAEARGFNQCKNLVYKMIDNAARQFSGSKKSRI